MESVNKNVNAENTQNNILKVLELFAGIGACSKALERLGIKHEIVDAVEIDKYAITSFNAIHGTNFEVQDITTWDKDIKVDLIMHGSPCQDISVAGKQEGADEGSGTRSSLMYETIRIVERLKPKYVIWENVKNLISKKHKHNFDNYVDIMYEGGYNSYYQVLNAKDYGIPQNRERVFTISIRKDIDKRYEFPVKEPLKLKLKDMLEDDVDEKYFLKDVQIERIKATTYVSGGVRRIQQRRVFGHIMCKRLQRSEMYSSRKFKKTRLSRIFKQSIFRRRNCKNINVNRWREFRQNRFIPCGKFKRRSLG